MERSREENREERRMSEEGENFEENPKYLT
jgi:hypothetical protein